MKPKILVVDDEPSHRKMLEAVLAEIGYEIQQADDGQSAIDAVEERFYDLILMDVRMSRVGGIEALKKIREISPGIPIIIMGNQSRDPNNYHDRIRIGQHGC
jgi:two-component system response regulator HydG